MLDPHGTVVGWNQGAERITGYSARTMTSDSRRTASTCPDRESGLPARILRAARETDATKRAARASAATARPSRPRHHHGAHLTLRRALGFAKVTRDLTETRQLEAQLQRSSGSKPSDQLAGGVAHDFNNLVTVIAEQRQFSLDEVPADSPVREHACPRSRARRDACHRPHASVAGLQPPAGHHSEGAQPQRRRVRHGQDGAAPDR